MTAVTNTTLYSAPQAIIYSLVNNRSNVADPRNIGAQRMFVYEVDPWEGNFDFTQVPYIVCRMPKLVGNHRSTNARTKDNNWTQQIVIRTLKKGSGRNRSDAGQRDMSQILDNLFTTFNSLTTRQTMNAVSLAMQDVIMTQEPVEVLVDDQIVLESIVEINYRVRMKVY